MNPWRWVDPRIEKVQLSQVQRYFFNRGWIRVANPNPNLVRFEETKNGKGPPLIQMVPASEQAADYRQRIMELITTLSELENRHPVEVLNEILEQEIGETPFGKVPGARLAKKAVI